MAMHVHFLPSPHSQDRRVAYSFNHGANIIFDINDQIESVDRRVDRRLVEGEEAATVIIAQTLTAEIAEVWDACTNAERIPRWFLPISGELKLGGEFQLERNAGGTIEECDPPNGFAATWEMDGGVSWIEVRLDAVDEDRTRLELEHIVRVDDHWEQYGPGATGVGWDGAIGGLAEYLRTGQPVHQQEAMAWMASEEGKEFYTRCSQRWGEAHIAAGADESEAREAAERTAGFYTGS